ncbi:putative leader peptide [Pseudonocardia spinosispora]|uniref:putative leader peptide n=1 Tax=Pseudonocardia spinosispora TaxID=103441 RepID=UPI003CCC0FC5
MRSDDPVDTGHWPCACSRGGGGSRAAGSSPYLTNTVKIRLLQAGVPRSCRFRWRLKPPVHALTLDEVGDGIRTQWLVSRRHVDLCRTATAICPA